MRTATGGIAAVFDALVANRRAPVGELDSRELRRLAAAGVEVTNGWARIDDDVELLRPAAVRSALTPQAAAWLVRLDIRAHQGSTNTALLDRARNAPVDGHVLAAEVQTAGRGRRGRDWHSPFARNLAVSLGMSLPRPAKEVGAFSLVVGLAVRAALADIGMREVMLKWPNDVLLNGRKLAGVLIEVASVGAPAAVVGIGVNIGGREALTGRVEQPVADVTEQVRRPSRNALLAALVNRLVAAARGFANVGFGPSVAEWERAHHHQNKAVTLMMPGDASATGTALGVDADGSLRLATASGVRTFISGEVSLRLPPAAPATGRAASRREPQ